MKKYLLSIVLFSIAVISYAQDTIVKKNNEKIICKVMEVGTAEIKYKPWDNLDGPIYDIKRSDVRKIIYQNGKVELITEDEYSVVPKAEFRARKRAVTIQPFAPLLGYFAAGYQQALTPSRALVSEVGVIGPHVGNYTGNAEGAFIKAGFRLKRAPEIVTPDMQYAYNLSGWYVQPELAFSSFSKSVNWYSNNYYMYSSGTSKYNFNSGAFLLTIGRQSVIGDIFTFDIYGSLGYAVVGSNAPKNSNVFEIEDLPRQYYAFSAGGKDLPIAWKFGLSIGILLK